MKKEFKNIINFEYVSDYVDDLHYTCFILRKKQK